MSILTKYRYYIYPLYVFIALFLILLLLKVFKSEVISLVEEEKNTSNNRDCFSNGNKTRVFIFWKSNWKK